MLSLLGWHGRVSQDVDKIVLASILHQIKLTRLKFILETAPKAITYFVKRKDFGPNEYQYFSQFRSRALKELKHIGKYSDR